MGGYAITDSPFLDTSAPFTSWEAVKFVLLLPTVPLRLAVILAVLITIALLNSLAVVGCDVSQPLAPWRRRLVEFSSRMGSRTLLALCGFWQIRVTGCSNLDEAKEVGALAVFNHVSYADPFVIVWLLCPCGVSKSANADLPIIGTAIKALQNLYVANERAPAVARPEGWSAASNGVGSVKTSTELIRDRVRDRRFPILAIAPEGTTASGHCLLSFKTGAFVPGAPVLPVLLDYRRSTCHHLGFGIIRPLIHFLRLMTQFANHLDITILPPYLPSEQEKLSPALYAANVRALMASQLRVPLVDQDRSTLKALEALHVRPSWDGRQILAPPGVLSADGRYVDLAGSHEKKKA